MIFSNRKGVFFNILIVLLLLLALIFAFIQLNNVFELDHAIGEPALDVFKTYQQGDKILSYLSSNSDRILREILFDYQESAGFSTSSCNNYHGFVVWDDSCTPDIDEITHNLEVEFAIRLEKELISYPNISFTRYELNKNIDQFSNEDVKEGSIGEFVDIPQSANFRCTDKLINENRCKISVNSLPGIDLIKQQLSPTQKVYVTYGIRSLEQQEYFFRKYLAYGTHNKVSIACGPTDIRNSIYKEIGNPDGSEIYVVKLNNYLKENPIVDESLSALESYARCPHVVGNAIDLTIFDGATKLSTAEHRKIMCSAGWVNYGAEWWHYEYKSWRWDQKRPDTLALIDIGNPSLGNYNSACWYGSRLST